MTFPFLLIDLTHTLSPTIPSWNGSCGFQHTIRMDYTADSPISFRVQQIKMHAGIGTHLDAPSHCIPGGVCIDAVPLESLVGPCICIDVSKKAHPLYVVSAEDIKAFEVSHGTIQAGSIIVIHTGWSERWSDRERYRNDFCFPSVSKQAAEYLLDRNVVALGVDTLSPDLPETDYPVHKTFLGAGKYLIENLANTDKLPATGSYILSLPIKTLDGTEAPARCVALLPRVGCC